MIKNILKDILGLKKLDVGTKNEETRYEWIIEKLKNFPKGLRILDAGAGELKFKKYCSHLNYVSQDFAQYVPASNPKGLQMEKWDYSGIDIVSDIINIPEPNNSFDVIMCIEVIEHIPDAAKVFPEFSRLLKPDGLLMITAPFCSLTHFAPFHYSTGFSKFYYEKHLNDNNFEIIEIKENGNYFEYMAQEVRRLQSISAKYSKTNASKSDKLIENFYLKRLQKLTSRDLGSNELLCFGLLVLARKK